MKEACRLSTHRGMMFVGCIKPPTPLLCAIWCYHNSTAVQQHVRLPGERACTSCACTCTQNQFDVLFVIGRVQPQQLTTLTVVCMHNVRHHMHVLFHASQVPALKHAHAQPPPSWVSVCQQASEFCSVGQPQHVHVSTIAVTSLRTHVVQRTSGCNLERTLCGRRTFWYEETSVWPGVAWPGAV